MQHVFLRHLAILQENRRRRASVNPHLVLFVARLEPRERALHDERREFLAVDLSKHHVHVREAAIGDPHLLPVQDVVLALAVQLRARPPSPAVGTRKRTAPTTPPAPGFGYFFLSRPLPRKKTGGRLPTPQRPPCPPQKPPIMRRLPRQPGGPILAQPRPAVLLRHAP